MKTTGLRERAKMAQHSDNPADPFKKALAEATKVLADDPELNVSYSVDPVGHDGRRDAPAPDQPPHDPRRGACRRAAPPMRWRCATAITTPRPMRATIPPARWRATCMRRWKPPAARRWARATCPAPRAISTPRSAPRPTVGLWPDHRSRRCAAGHRRGLSRAPPCDRARPARGRAERHGPLARLHREPGRRHARDLQDILADQTEFARFARQVIRDLGYGDQLGEDPDRPRTTTRTTSPSRTRNEDSPTARPG